MSMTTPTPLRRARVGRRLTLPLVVAFALVGCAMPAPSTPTASQPALQAPLAAPQVLAAGVVKGRVVAFDRAAGRFSPLGGAAIRVEGTAFSATSDDQGGYSLEGLPPGDYTVRAVKDGYAGEPAQVKVNAVMGLERVDLAVAATSGAKAFGLAQAPSPPTQLPTSDFTVFGIIRDPRGCAVPGARMFITASSGQIDLENAQGTEVSIVSAKDGSASLPLAEGDTAKLTTTSGYYWFQAQGADEYVRFTVSVSGSTPGGINLERSGTAFTVDRNDTNTAIQDADKQAIVIPFPEQFDVQLNKFTGALTPTGFPPYTLGEEAAELRVASGLSSRPDEFFVRLVQGRDQYDIVPIEVKQAGGVGTAYDTVVFRIPSTLSTTQNFTASIVQLGLQPSSPSLPLSIGSLDLATFVTTVQQTRNGRVVQPALRQLNDGFAVQNKFFTDAERLQLRVPVRNPRTFDLSVEVGFDLGGVSAATAKLGTRSFSVSIDPGTERITVPFVIPARTSGTDLVIEFTLSGRTNANPAVKATGILVRDPRRTDPGSGDPLQFSFSDTNELTVRAFDETGWGFAKALSDDGTVNNGIGRVVLSIVPPANYVGPQGAFRVFDITDNNLNGPIPTVFIEGDAITTDIAFTPVTIPTTPDADRTAVFVLGVPGALDAERAVVVPSGPVGLTALQQAFEDQLGTDTIDITQTTGVGDDPLKFTLVNGGNKLALKSAGSALALLGLTGPIAAATRTGGITATLAGATTNLPGWTVRPVTADSTLTGVDSGPALMASDVTLYKGAVIGKQDSDGKTVIAFEVVPAANAQPFTNAAPLQVTYRIVADGTSNITIGDGSNEGGAKLMDHAYLGPILSFKALGLSAVALTPASAAGI
ncbi:MAG: carboxypeptidase-like regulatory domain-containing protein [Candidatus Sericytochromatia bacterium]|nr:carboxypeptidase-like regulatory domain-containing protein [Candidatus Sericytochromatia bacterium]